MQRTYLQSAVFGKTAYRDAAGHMQSPRRRQQPRARRSEFAREGLVLVGKLQRAGERVGGDLPFQTAPRLLYTMDISAIGGPIPVYIFTEIVQRAADIPAAKNIHAKTFQQGQWGDICLSIHRYRLLFPGIYSA